MILKDRVGRVEGGGGAGSAIQTKGQATLMGVCPTVTVCVCHHPSIHALYPSPLISSGILLSLCSV